MPGDALRRVQRPGHVNVTPDRCYGRLLPPAALPDFNDKRLLLRFHRNPVVRFSSKKQIGSSVEMAQP